MTDETHIQRLHAGILGVIGHGMGLQGNHLQALVGCVTYTLALAEQGDPTASDRVRDLARAFWPSIEEAVMVEVAEKKDARRFEKLRTSKVDQP